MTPEALEVEERLVAAFPAADPELVAFVKNAVDEAVRGFSGPEVMAMLAAGVDPSAYVAVPLVTQLSGAGFGTAPTAQGPVPVVLVQLVAAIPASWLVLSRVLGPDGNPPHPLAGCFANGLTVRMLVPLTRLTPEGVRAVGRVNEALQDAADALGDHLAGDHLAAEDEPS